MIAAKREGERMEADDLCSSSLVQAIKEEIKQKQVGDKKSDTDDIRSDKHFRSYKS